MTKKTNIKKILKENPTKNEFTILSTKYGLFKIKRWTWTPNPAKYHYHCHELAVVHDYVVLNSPWDYLPKSDWIVIKAK